LVDDVVSVAGSGGTCTFLVSGQPALTAALKNADWQRIGLSVQLGGQDYVGVVTFDDIVVTEPFEGADTGCQIALGDADMTFLGRRGLD
jgi:hypothetical protein